VFESEARSEADLREKADRWLNEAQAELEKQFGEFPLLEPSDHRFLLRMDRGAELSQRRTALLAELLDRRNAICNETGVDIILEQYFVLKSVLDYSPDSSS
jgi:hypothetical protein